MSVVKYDNLQNLPCVIQYVITCKYLLKENINYKFRYSLVFCLNNFWDAYCMQLFAEN